MAATTISRATWMDGASGTVLNNARLQADVYDRFDAVLAGNLVIGGTIASEALGTHEFSAGGAGPNILRVRNTSAGTANYGGVIVGNDGTASAGWLYATSSTFNNPAAFNVAAGCTLLSVLSGGLSVATSDANATMRFYTNSAERLRISATGNVGIGTTSPVAALHLSSSAALGIRIHSTANGNANLRLITAARDWLIENSVGDGSLQVQDVSQSAIRARWDTSGHFAPGADNAYACGTASLRWSDLRTVQFSAGDISLENGMTLTEHYKVHIDTPGIAFLNSSDELVGFLSDDGRWHARETRLLDEIAWTKTTKEERATMSAPLM